jgi:methyltransferase
MVILSFSDELFIGLIVALACERVFELWLSARNASRQLARGAQEFGQGHYRVMAVFHLLFLVSCLAEMLILHPRPLLGLTIVSLAGAGGAQALRYWAVSTLGEHWNTRVIVRPGDSPVTAGPYRFVRHPNYVAVALELVAVPLVHDCWRTALVFSLGNFALLAVRIPIEERALGVTYATVFGHRPRFFPGAGNRG